MKSAIQTSSRRVSGRQEETVLAEESSSVSGFPGGKILGSAKPSEMTGASIWRAYFVASNWAEMQTIRRVKPCMQLFWTLFFLKVVGFETLALADPRSNLTRSEEQYHIPYSNTCRFAIGAAVYLAVALVQFAIHKTIYERFIEDKLQQFVDLCSVSNVSVFIMCKARYGFYIHGRSTHGRADVNMKEMHEHLRREEEDLCSQRGLIPNTEQQTFQMSLPAGVNEQYFRLLLPLTAYSQTADRMQGAGGRLTRVDIDRVVSTYLMVNKFLSGFVEHAFKDLDYTVKDKLFMENLFDIEFSDVNGRGYFYNDNGHSFDNVLFCGKEVTLLLFEMLLFCVLDATSNNFLLAAILTFFVTKIIEAIRKSAGRRNLVRKALIDERFLN